jgi:hypothetical protein
MSANIDHHLCRPNNCGRHDVQQRGGHDNSSGYQFDDNAAHHIDGRAGYQYPNPIIDSADD